MSGCLPGQLERLRVRIVSRISQLGFARVAARELPLLSLLLSTVVVAAASTDWD